MRGIRGRASMVVVIAETTASVWRAAVLQPSLTGSMFSWLRKGTSPLMIATRRSEATLRAIRSETITESWLRSIRHLPECHRYPASARSVHTTTITARLWLSRGALGTIWGRSGEARGRPRGNGFLVAPVAPVWQHRGYHSPEDGHVPCRRASC